MLMGPFFLTIVDAMRPGPSLLVTMALVWSALAASGAARQQASQGSGGSGTSTTPLATSSQPAAPALPGASEDYLGSAACQRCHEAEHGQ